MNEFLDKSEIDFIKKLAADFIESYSYKGEVKVDGDDADEILQEIAISRSLLNKFQV